MPLSENLKFKELLYTFYEHLPFKSLYLILYSNNIFIFVIVNQSIIYSENLTFYIEYILIKMNRLTFLPYLTKNSI